MLSGKTAASVAAGTALITGACASVQPPPGGPPDPNPPAIVAIIPDSGSVAEGLRDPLVIQFDEVIDERSGGGLERLLRLAPVKQPPDIDWKRTAVAIKPKEGWRSGIVYHLRILPGISDLRNNRLTEGRTVIFSTGGPIPATRLEGTVLDWQAGRAAPRALVEAILLPDSLVYPATADSVGDFLLASIPPGRYHVRAIVDANNNGRRDFREPFDSVTLTLDSAASHVFWAFRQDTVGPRIARGSVADSFTLRLELDQGLLPEQLEQTAVEVLALPDSVPVNVQAILRQEEYDSLRAAERQNRPAAEPDTGAARRQAPADTLPRTPGEAQAPASPDTSRAARLLSSRPRLSPVVMVRLEKRLEPGSRYLIRADAVNLLGYRQQSRFLLVVPDTGGRR
ncbi:MAG: hypothetical protein KatS3mg081_0729 [Gemmatimonadales bacterium]|nr:hypothetical protein HRbin33_02587 [bacterium HR33]GIW51374.1 MAG: hypothetical protein KatS3mg081_0729 [Gemmatimonadales bacterium]